MSSKLRAAVLRTAAQPLVVDDVLLADPGPREVLVRTVRAGICGTDLHFAAGVFPYPTPTVLGHEAAGVVEAVGTDVTDVAVGGRVIVCDQVFCGRCGACLSGQMVYCTDPARKTREQHRLHIDGVAARQYLGVAAFAELLLVDANALVPMPAGLSFDAAALLSCCLTTGVAAVFNVARPAPGSRVAVFGCGGVGLAAVQAARIAGAAQIIAVDPQPHRRDLAIRLGATDVVDPTGTDVVAAVCQVSNGGADRSVEAVGRSATVVDAVRVLRPGGQATVLGMLAPGDDPVLPGRLLRQGRSVGGTVMGSVRTRVDIPRYADLVLRGLLHADAMATAHHPLSRIADAMTAAQAHHGARTMITF